MIYFDKKSKKRYEINMGNVKKRKDYSIKKLSIYKVIQEIKKTDETIKLSEVKILSIINKPEFWVEFVEFWKIQIKK